MPARRVRQGRKKWPVQEFGFYPRLFPFTTGSIPIHAQRRGWVTKDIIERLVAIIGATHVATGDAATRWSRDWLGQRQWQPLAVARPHTRDEVALIVRLANETRTPIVPVGGHTGLVGGPYAEGAVMLSLDRMSSIREIRPDARIAIVEAGVVLSALHDAAEAHDLIFPLFFGARGSAMIGGCLSTNAGGSNVLRHGNSRDLCLGLEVVLPTGEVMNLMSELHKNNAGYDLRHLMIGAEGTLGVITAAVLKLKPKPLAYATAMVAVPGVGDALTLLNRLQRETAGAVEAFEYMPGSYINAYLRRFPAARAPFDTPREVNILVEVGATAPRDAEPDASGEIPVIALLESVLGTMFEAGDVLDAVVARSDAQRQEMWARREAAAEVSRLHETCIDNDIAVGLDKVELLIDNIRARALDLDPGLHNISVAHLGDGNLHFAGWPSTEDIEVHAAIKRAVEEETAALGGSFSAEHGIGLDKQGAMTRHKDAAALAAMRTIKAALDPHNIMNPGKILPKP